MEIERKKSGGGDVDSTVHVAVGRDVKEGKMLLSWTVKNLAGRNVSLVYVHQPTGLTSLLNGKRTASKIKEKAVKTCQEFERSKMRKLMNQYFLFLSQMEIQAEMLWTETSNVEEGILQLIVQHGIKCFVMGASDETVQTKKSSEINSRKAMVVCQQAPPSCQIFFISNGCVIYTRHLNSQLNTPLTLLSSSNIDGTTLEKDLEESIDTEAENDQCLEQHPTRSLEEVLAIPNHTTLKLGKQNADNSPSTSKEEYTDHLSSSSSPISWDSGPQELETRDLHNELGRVLIHAEDSEHKSLEESLEHWRAENDSLEVECMAEEAAESLGLEKSKGIKEIEGLILIQKQEMKMMENKHEELSRKLQLIHDQKPALENQLREAYSSEKELEEKIIQAVNLLITFKETRDKLQIEYDSTARRINKYRTLLQTSDPLPISHPPLFGISFSEIVEATDDFNPSHKIGEGRYGSVYKGMLSHVKVAIKMLPSSGSQSDSEFKNEVEALCRVRHPNLVTLMGTCVESRSLVYEYIDNITLEDYLKSHTPSWQTRMRIAIEITSVLLFLHANFNSNVHGNINSSNILLDSNLVAKVSDFGIHDLIPQDQNPILCSNFLPEKLAYVDPESTETGKCSTESDIYSFGLVLFRLLTMRPVTNVVRDVRCALETGNFESVLDMSAGEWPLKVAEKLANLALRCCGKDPFDRPDLELEIWPVLEQMRVQSSSPSSCENSSNTPEIPSHFVCPIFQEVMKDPHIAGDGFTYEGDAIRGWFNSGHETSPMTNLKLDNCELIPNYSLFYAIQEWQQNT